MNILKQAFNKIVNKENFSLQSNNLSGLLTGFDSGNVNHGTQNEQKLIDTGYGQNVTVYSIINKITTTGADIPLIVWDKQKDELVEKGKIFDVLQQPAIYRGELLDTKQWIEACFVYLLSSGNLYQRKTNLVDQANYDSLEIIPSGIIEPIEPSSFLSMASGYQLNDKYKQYKIEAELMSHLKYINPTTLGLNSLEGLAPLQAGLYSLTGSTDIQKALSVLVKNQGVRGIITNESNRNGSGVNLGVEEAKAVKEKIASMIRGIDKVNQVAVTGASLKYQAMGMTANDLKLIESGVLTDRQLCNLFNIDSKLFNDPSSSTFNNLNEATKGMYNNAILPNLNKIVGKFNQDIVKPLNIRYRTNEEVRIDKSKIEALQDDQKAEAEKNKINADGFAVVLNMPISNDSKKEVLIYTYGLTEDLADKIVTDGTNESE